MQLGFFMQEKLDTQCLLHSFITFAYTQFHIRVKAVQTDNDTKFLSMRQFLLIMTLNDNIHVSISLNKMG